jgi:sporulation integral membrane protein YlbJ
METIKSMKRIKSNQTIKSNKVLKYIIITVFIIMLLNPVVTLSGAKNGLILWFNVIIPSLLPSIIISNIIVSVYGDTFKNPFLYIIFTGLLCGYPLGAATTVQLSKKTKIDHKKLQLLMAVCNNSSPMFITNYMIISTLNQKANLFQLLVIIYFPLLFILMLLFIQNRHVMQQSKNSNVLKKAEKKLDINAIDSSIMAGFEIVTKVGGYIILFSIFGAYIQSLPIKNELLKCIISGILEITTGIHCIGKAGFPIELKKLLACIFCAFGGLSCIAQTNSIIHKSDFSIKKYIYHKLLITLFTAFIAILMIYVW